MNHVIRKVVSIIFSLVGIIVFYLCLPEEITRRLSLFTIIELAPCFFVLCLVWVSGYLIRKPDVIIETVALGYKVVKK